MLTSPDSGYGLYVSVVWVCHAWYVAPRVANNSKLAILQISLAIRVVPAESDDSTIEQALVPEKKGAEV